MGICEIGRYENFKNIKRDVEFSTSLLNGCVKFASFECKFCVNYIKHR